MKALALFVTIEGIWFAALWFVLSWLVGASVPWWWPLPVMGTGLAVTVFFVAVLCRATRRQTMMEDPGFDKLAAELQRKVRIYTCAPSPRRSTRRGVF